jgi:hypothetical protein
MLLKSSNNLLLSSAGLLLVILFVFAINKLLAIRAEKAANTAAEAQARAAEEVQARAAEEANEAASDIINILLDNTILPLLKLKQAIKIQSLWRLWIVKHRRDWARNVVELLEKSLGNTTTETPSTSTTPSTPTTPTTDGSADGRHEAEELPPIPEPPELCAARIISNVMAKETVQDDSDTLAQYVRELKAIQLNPEGWMNVLGNTTGLPDRTIQSYTPFHSAKPAKRPFDLSKLLQRVMPYDEDGDLYPSILQCATPEELVDILQNSRISYFVLNHYFLLSEASASDDKKSHATKHVIALIDSMKPDLINADKKSNLRKILTYYLQACRYLHDQKAYTLEPISEQAFNHKYHTIFVPTIILAHALGDKSAQYNVVPTSFKVMLDSDDVSKIDARTHDACIVYLFNMAIKNKSLATFKAILSTINLPAMSREKKGELFDIINEGLFDFLCFSRKPQNHESLAQMTMLLFEALKTRTNPPIIDFTKNHKHQFYFGLIPMLPFWPTERMSELNKPIQAWLFHHFLAGTAYDSAIDLNPLFNSMTGVTDVLPHDIIVTDVLHDDIIFSGIFFKYFIYPNLLKYESDDKKKILLRFLHALNCKAERLDMHDRVMIDRIDTRRAHILTALIALLEATEESSVTLREESTLIIAGDELSISSFLNRTMHEFSGFLGICTGLSIKVASALLNNPDISVADTLTHEHTQLHGKQPTDLSIRSAIYWTNQEKIADNGCSYLSNATLAKNPASYDKTQLYSLIIYKRDERSRAHSLIIGRQFTEGDSDTTYPYFFFDCNTKMCLVLDKLYKNAKDLVSGLFEHLKIKYPGWTVSNNLSLITQEALEETSSDIFPTVLESQSQALVARNDRLAFRFRARYKRRKQEDEQYTDKLYK